MDTELARLHDILAAHGSPLAARIAALQALAARDREAAWAQVNSDAFWGGVGSLVDYTMRANPAVPANQWDVDVRELRELLIALGQALIARGNENPRVSSWVLALSNWNASGV